MKNMFVEQKMLHMCMCLSQKAVSSDVTVSAGEAGVTVDCRR